MYEYPSIMSGTGANFREFDAYVFAKLDGRNVRFEYTRKKGWHKAGTRDRRFDETDREFGTAIGLFQTTLAEGCERIIRSERWDRVTAFAEFWGEETLGGVLVPGAAMRVSLFDVAVNEDLIGPRDFVKLFVDKVETAPYLGRHHWTRGFVERVYQGEIEGASFEGVVGKGVRGEMAKAKTKAWLDAVRSRYAPDVAEKIVNS